jgi:tetraprenyl-beta-curcumene synthase
MDRSMAVAPPVDAGLPAPMFADRRLLRGAVLALAAANVRYWTTVAPIVRGELTSWKRRARAIEDDQLRALALEKLRGEGFNAEAGAALATLAPRAHRRDAAWAIVALELLFDYLDGRTERPLIDPLRDGERLFGAFIDAVGAGWQARRDDAHAPDGGYLQALSDGVAGALARLPGAPTIAAGARASAARAAQAQIRMHASAQLGREQLETWARGEADGGELEWRELLLGAASSVLLVHALIAAAADPRTTPSQAQEIAEAYLDICVLLTLLDGLIDHEHDALPENAGRPGYLSLYSNPEELADALTAAAERAAGKTRKLHNAPHHTMLLVAVAAYYISAPGADTQLTRPIAERLRAELAPLMPPTLALMRAWRRARRPRPA